MEERTAMAAEPGLVGEEIPAAAFKGVTFPKLNIESNTQVWEIMESYDSWKQICITQAGMITVEAQTLLKDLFEWTTQLYEKFMKSKNTTFPTDPRNWDTKTKTAETRLAAHLNTAVPAEVMKATLALAEGIGDIQLEDHGGREPSYSRSVKIIFNAVNC